MKASFQIILEKMFHNSKLFLLFLVTFFLPFTLFSCQSDNSPTQDVNYLYTAGAQTVVSRLTETPIFETSAPRVNLSIPLSSTNPREGSSFPENDPIIGNSQVAQTDISPEAASNFRISGETPDPNNRPDRCQWVEQDPPDNSSLAGNTGFITTWVIKNVGVSTWSQQYQAVWYNANGSERIGSDLPITYTLSNDVGPDEFYRFKVEMQAPLKPGKYYSLWGLQNVNGKTFCTFDLTINVK